MLWDLAEGKRLYSLDAGAVIHALCFSPNHYWLCAATQTCIKIWDLERYNKTVLTLFTLWLASTLKSLTYGVSSLFSFEDTFIYFDVGDVF